MILNAADAVYSYPEGFSLGPVNFSAGEGCFMVILGPNGSGKSTLFSLLNGLIKPSSGSIKADLRNISAITPAERARLIGMIPQTSAGDFDYTVREMVMMGRYPYQRLFSPPSDEDNLVVDRVLDQLDMSMLSGRSVRHLSGGEYQRVLLGRVLAQQTDILLLDEPGNHLDLKHQLKMLGYLRTIADSGKTVVAVLHDLNQAMHYADFGIMLKQGKTVVSGKPSEFITPALVQEVYDTRVSEYFCPENGDRIIGPASAGDSDNE